MPLPVDTNSFDYKFNKTLNEDVRLVSDEYGKFDLDMDNGDYVNVAGHASLLNACIIAIMTRFNEISNSTYSDFGCKVHDLIKDNQTKMFLYKLETSINDVLVQIRRIKIVNWIKISKSDGNTYSVCFNITSINDEVIKGKVSL